VAGIIGAADNGTGVLGVLPGVRLVSVALGHINSGSCSTGDPETGGYLLSAFVQGLDIISARVSQSGTVGIVNISFNLAGAFASNGTLGQKLKVLATPVNYFLFSYKGAFIVQSAGNQFSDACSFAYNAPDPGDGIMVVGGLDDNGQPVKDFFRPPDPIINQPRDLPGYQNLPVGGDDHGSNYGNCVEVWAPSKRVKSTWAGGSTVLLSGTSMAAPHIAGFAARILESTSGITTSLALEAAVRARMMPLTGTGLFMPHLTNIAAAAAPTIEIAEGTNRTAVNGWLFHSVAVKPDGSSAIDLRFQAVGASSCAVVTSNYYAPWDYWYAIGTQTYLAQSSLLSVPLNANLLQPGKYRWSIACTSAQGTVSNATADGFVRRSVSLHWWANTTSTFGAWQELQNAVTVSWSISANAPFSQKYQTLGADSCSVVSLGYNGNVIGDADNPAQAIWMQTHSIPPFFQQSSPPLWVSGIYPTFADFGTWYFGDPRSPSSPYGQWDGYKWLLTCSNTDGDTKKTVMYGTWQP
jgi:hypothetical protein